MLDLGVLVVIVVVLVGVLQVVQAPVLYRSVFFAHELSVTLRRAVHQGKLLLFSISGGLHWALFFDLFFYFFEGALESGLLLLEDRG